MKEVRESERFSIKEDIIFLDYDQPVSIRVSPSQWDAATCVPYPVPLDNVRAPHLTPFSGSLQPLRFRGTAELLIGIASVLSFQRIRGAACMLAQSGPFMFVNGWLRFRLGRTDLRCPSICC